MNIARQSIVALLKSIITQQPQPLPDGFSMEEVVAQSKSHHIVTAVYEGALLCGVSPAEPVMKELFPQYCKALQISVRQMREIDRVFSAFEEKGIDYLPLKGSRMKALYPKPELRMMGDADVLIRMEQYEKIAPVMQALNFRDKYESDHELIWESDGLYLELHKRLIPSYNGDFYEYFGEGWQFARHESGTRYVMSPEDEMIYLFTHFAKHYRDGGIGCRYVADLWVYLRANPDLDESYIEAQLEQMKLLEFYRNIRQVIAVWFENAQSDEKTEFVSDFIFAGGSWGNKESNRLSQAVRDSKHSPVGKNAKLTYLWRLTFPSAKALEKRYPVLKKHRWMLPLIWVWRPFYRLFHGGDNLKTHRQNLEALAQQNVDERQQALEYVGLDYNF